MIEKNTPVDSADRPAESSWLDSLSEETRTLAEAKGWAAAEDAIKSYSALESYLGADKAGRGVILPKDEGDAEAFDRIYQALGRPEEAAAYGLAELLDGREHHQGLVEALGQAMLTAGLNKKQAQSLAKSYIEAEDAILSNLRASYAAEVAQAREQLSPALLEQARRGARFLELSEAELAPIEQALGPSKAAEIFGRIGRALAEDQVINNPSGAAYGSPNAKIAQLRSDPIFLKRYLGGEPGAVEQLSELYRQAAASSK